MATSASTSSVLSKGYLSPARCSLVSPTRRSFSPKNNHGIYQKMCSRRLAVIRSETTEESTVKTEKAAANPFMPGKLSSRIQKAAIAPAVPVSPDVKAIQTADLEKPAVQASTAAKETGSIPSPVKELLKSSPKPVQAISPTAASRIISAVPPTPRVKPTPSFSGKKVLSAFKEGDKFENTIKVSRPRNAPANIFDDPRRTKEQIEAEKWRFALNSEQILLVLSFVASSALMFATVWVVWKMGAIHFNEY